MDFTRLPTDNLYKVLAIGGIALVAVAFYWPFQIGYQIQDEISNIVRLQNSRMVGLEESFIAGLANPKPIVFRPDSLAVLTQDRNEREQAREDFAGLYEELTAELYDINLARVTADAKVILEGRGENPDLLSAPTILEETENDLRTERASVHQVREDVYQMWQDTEMIWSKMDHVTRSNSFGLAGMIAGTLFALLGFALWHLKLQRFQDAAARKQQT
jgi:hypothetical protein